jgi:N-acetylglutamate synthase-like GNAT family acetyltransferase
MEKNAEGKSPESHLDGPRALRIEEHPAAMRFVDSIFRPEHPGAMAKGYPHVFDKDNIENMRVIVKDGEIISHTAIYLSTIRSRDLSFKMGGISAVGTNPDYRGQGLAGSVMRDCVEVMRERGCHLSFLWTDLHDFYREFGYEPAGSFYLLKPDESILSNASPDCEIVNYSPDRLPEIIEIHNRESLRTERAAKEYETFFSLPRIKALVALRDGKVSAYAVQGLGRDLKGFMHDWGGEPQDLLCLARELSTQSETGELYVLAPTCENDFTSLLVDMDVPRAYMKLVMLNVIDVEGVSSIVSDYVSAKLGLDFRITQDAAGVKISVGSEEAYIDPPRMLAGVLFGPEPPSTFLSNLSAETLSALDKALPIPLFIWGLDWV